MESRKVCLRVKHRTGVIREGKAVGGNAERGWPMIRGQCVGKNKLSIQLSNRVTVVLNNAVAYFKTTRGGNFEYSSHEGMVSAQGDVYVNFP